MQSFHEKSGTKEDLDRIIKINEKAIVELKTGFDENNHNIEMLTEKVNQTEELRQKSDAKIKSEFDNLNQELNEIMSKSSLFNGKML
jgi:predicted RNase H-like nuclease (RuvC/YqgF family)